MAARSTDFLRARAYRVRAGGGSWEAVAKACCLTTVKGAKEATRRWAWENSQPWPLVLPERHPETERRTLSEILRSLDVVADPDKNGWWDGSLTEEECHTRIRGLARCLAKIAGNAPKGLLAAEYAVLAGLRGRFQKEFGRFPP